MTPITFRPVTPDDIDALAALHARAWIETYRGLLPDTLIASRSAEALRLLWQRIVASPLTRTAWAPGIGFCTMGPQRDAALAALGATEELYAIYLLADAQGKGHGRALFAALDRGPPLSILVFEGNRRARAFHEGLGARLHAIRDETIDGHPIREAVYLRPARP
ncbi:MAG: GNAT family N-acetyltransferase [Gemmobacter sp.]